MNEKICNIVTHGKAKVATQLKAWSVFILKKYLTHCKNSLAYYNASVIVVNSKVAGLGPAN
jgi:hypothetical protein